MPRPSSSVTSNNSPGANPQAREMGGFRSIEEVIERAPETTSGPSMPSFDEIPKRGRPKGSINKKDVTDPTANMPPNVQRFMREMLAEDIGGFGTVPYEIAAWWFNTPELKLTDKEKQHWADGLETYAYLKGWSTNSPLVVLLSLIVMQFEFAVKRTVMWAKANGVDIPEMVMQWMGLHSDNKIAEGEIMGRKPQ